MYLKNGYTLTAIPRNFFVTMSKNIKKKNRELLTSILDPFHDYTSVPDSIYLPKSSSSALAAHLIRIFII